MFHSVSLLSQAPLARGSRALPSVLFHHALENNFIKPVFVPAGCTGELQHLYVAINDSFKKELKSALSSWYANEVSKALNNVSDIDNIHIDL